MATKKNAVSPAGQTPNPVLPATVQMPAIALGEAYRAPAGVGISPAAGLDLVAYGDNGLTVPGLAPQLVHQSSKGSVSMRAPNIGEHCYKVHRRAWNAAHQAKLIAEEKRPDGTPWTAATLPIATKAEKAVCNTELEAIRAQVNSHKAVVCSIMSRADVFLTNARITQTGKGLNMTASVHLPIAKVSVEAALAAKITEQDAEIAKLRKQLGIGKAAGSRKREQHPAKDATLENQATAREVAPPVGAPIA